MEKATYYKKRGGHRPFYGEVNATGTKPYSKNVMYDAA